MKNIPNVDEIPGLYLHFSNGNDIADSRPFFLFRIFFESFYGIQLSLSAITASDIRCIYYQYVIDQQVNKKIIKKGIGELQKFMDI